MALHASTKTAIDSPVIPDRLYFKIGDVARICGVETYVLRFWESQFPQLKPNKSGKGQRLYRRRDVEQALDIKRLVHQEGYTIAGARQSLEGQQRRTAAAPAAASRPLLNLRPEAAQTSDASRSAIAQVKSELREIAAMLSSPPLHARRERPKVVRVRPESDRLFPL